MPRPRKNFRAPEDIQSILLRMSKPFVESLDTLCEANGRSRREIVEILVSEARLELKDNPSARINPL